MKCLVCDIDIENLKLLDISPWPYNETICSKCKAWIWNIIFKTNKYYVNKEF